MSPKLQSNKASAPNNLSQLLDECADGIDKAFEAASIEAALQDKPAKAKLTFTMTVNLETDALKSHLGWSIAYGKTIEETLKDPNQLELNTRSSGGGSVSLGQAEAIVKMSDGE